MTLAPLLVEIVRTAVEVDLETGQQLGRITLRLANGQRVEAVVGATDFGIIEGAILAEAAAAEAGDRTPAPVANVRIPAPFENPDIRYVAGDDVEPETLTLDIANYPRTRGVETFDDTPDAPEL